MGTYVVRTHKVLDDIREVLDSWTVLGWPKFVFLGHEELPDPMEWRHELIPLFRGELELAARAKPRIDRDVARLLGNSAGQTPESQPGT